MPTPPGVVVDTNVWISGLLFGGKPEEIIKLAEKGGIKAVISLFILQEIKNTLGTKFNLPENELRKSLARILVASELVEIPEQSFKAALRDPNDNAIIQTAIKGKCKWLVTGDKDLLVLEKFQNIPIVNPSQFLLKYRAS